MTAELQAKLRHIPFSARRTEPRKTRGGTKRSLPHKPFEKRGLDVLGWAARPQLLKPPSAGSWLPRTWMDVVKAVNEAA